MNGTQINKNRVQLFKVRIDGISESKNQFLSRKLKNHNLFLVVRSVSVGYVGLFRPT